MVFGQPLHVVLQRVDAGRGQDAGLTHASAGNLSPSVRLADQLRAAAEHRTCRSAKSLGEAERYGIEPGGDLACRNPELSGGIEQAGAVQVERQVVAFRAAFRLVQVGKRQRAAALGVFQAKKSGHRVVVVGRLYCAGYLVQIEGAIRLEVDRLGLYSAKDGATASFPPVDVGVLPGYVLVAARAVGEQGEEVAHGAAGNEERSLFAQHLCGH